MAKGKKIPFSLAKGMWSGGDAATIPPDAARRLRNVVRKNGPWVARPQFTYEGIARVRGLAKWYDDATDAQRVIALAADASINVKDASGETYTVDADTVVGGGALTYIRDSASYRGRLYTLLTSVGGVMAGIRYFCSYSGAGFDQIELDREDVLAIEPDSIAVFKERMMYGGVMLAVDDLLRNSNVDMPYDPSLWTAANVNTSSLTVGAGTLYRATPSNTTTASLTGPTINTSGGATVTFRAMLRGVHQTYTMPVTLSLKYVPADWAAGTTYVANDFVGPGNGYVYRCTVGGSSHAVTEPTWPTTIGGTVTDNTVTWKCEATDVPVSSKVYIPSATDSDEFLAFYVTGKNLVTKVAPVITFGHDGAAITLASVDFGFKDGLANGDPRKENHGQQVTLGPFCYPFANEDNSSGNYDADFRDHIFWSEVGLPENIEAANYYKISEIPGPITVIRALGGKLVAFKRRAFWIFGATNDPDNPILPEGDARVGIGCVNPKAIDIFEDAAYFIGENEIYRMTLGDAPEPLCGEGMRDEIMNKASGAWVETLSQTADGQAAQRPLLAIDQNKRRMWVYTQKGKLYCYDLDAKVWSVHDAGGTASSNTGYQVTDMLYCGNTGSLYVAFYSSSDATIGLARLDETQTGAEDTLAASGTLPVYKDIWLRPVEVDSREDVCLEQLDIYHKITASQTSQTLTAYHSFDHGANFSTFETLTVSPVSGGEYDPIQIPYYQSGGTILPRILHSGKGGAENFNISRIVATVEVLSGDGAYPQETP